MTVSPIKQVYAAIFSMVAAFLAAVALAVGHHAYYRSLSGQPVVNTGSLGSFSSSLHISDQQIHISLGSVFAFAVKTLLSSSVSTAFAQFSWRSIQDRTTKISVVDDLFSALENAFTTLNLSLWKRYPISMLLSAIFWLLPVSSIITPATLNVDMVSFDVFALRRVPRIDFASSNFATLPDSEFGSTSNKSWSNVITGSSSYTQSIVAGAATQGTVLAIDPPAVNSSWKLDFHGPAIVCNTVNESLSTLIKQNIEGATNASTTVGRILYDYLSWVPTGNNLESWTPFNQSENGTYIQRTAISSPVFPNADVQTVENLSHMPLSIFVATFPHMREWDGTAHNMNQVMRDSTILRCVLHNATYHANFKFVNGFQSIDMTDENLHGAVDFVDGITNLPTSTSGIYMNSSYINSEWLMETFSYQSILDAFGQILVGSISSHIVTTGGKDSPKIYSADASISGTNILSTVLAKCEELSFLRSVINGVLQDEFTSYWRGKSNYPSYSTSQSLRDGLEEIFRNITFSFMSSNLFQ